MAVPIKPTFLEECLMGGLDPVGQSGVFPTWSWLGYLDRT